MSELNIKQLFDLAGTIIGVVTENEDGSVTVDNPAFLVPSEEGIQLIPALQALGVHDEETQMHFKQSELKYGKVFRPYDAVVHEYKLLFGYAAIAMPEEKKLIL